MLLPLLQDGRGDSILNVALDNGTEVRKDGQRVRVGCVVMRGSSIIMLEALDRIA